MFNALAVRCVPEGQLESRPAIYRRCWCLEVDLVPEGRSKLGLALADTFSSLNVHFVFARRIANLCWWAKSRRARICQYSKETRYRLLKNDIFGIDRAAVFGRPSGTRPHVLPNPAINRRATLICPSGTGTKCLGR
jgi:hypothetical protein